MHETFLRNGGYFKKCKAGSLFTIKGNPQLDKENFVFSNKSEYPYFTRTVFNNGIYGYVDYLDESHLIKGNSIAVGMMGMKFFYMSHDFYAGQFTKTVFPKFNGFNSRIALWFISWFNKSSKKFLSVLVREFEKVFSDTEIIVPYHANGDLALDYIESRIREMEESRIREMDAYLQASGFENCELTEEEQRVISLMDNGKVKFKSFYVTDDAHKGRSNGVFTVKNSHNILQSSITPNSGTIPYVTAGEGNNSISTYISYDKTQIEKGNSIMIGGKTMVITYQSEDFFSNDSHNLVLHVKNPLLANELTQLFLVTSLNRSLKPIYSWGDSISSKKIKKDILNLPVTPSGDIDYHFMETYIRAIEKQTIQRVKDWRAKEISTTKDMVTSDTSSKPSAPLYVLPLEERNVAMVAEDILIYGSLEVRLRSTKKSDLLAGTLDLVLMYAISPAAREKTEKAGRIALGIKESNLSEEAIKAYQSVRYIMFHYWKNSEAKPFALTAPTRLVSRADIPEGFLLRQEKDAKQYLLLEYNPASPTSIGELDILKAQRKGSNRYMPFVCRIESITKSTVR